MEKRINYPQLRAIVEGAVTAALQKERKAPAPPETPGKNSVLVLATDNAGDFAPLLEQAACTYAGRSLYFGFFGAFPLPCPEGTEALDVSEPRGRTFVLRYADVFERVDLLSPSLSELQKIAGLSDDSLLSRFVIHRLLHNGAVRVIRDYEPAKLRPEKLKRHVLELEASLDKLGIAVLSEYEGAGNTAADKSVQHGLLNAEAVEEAAKRGAKEIQRSAECLVTPLALERAKELGVSIRVIV